MATMTVEEAQANLKDVIAKLGPGEGVVLTDNAKPIATIIASTNTNDASDRRPSGTLKGTVLYMAPDFDEPLDEFAEYMQ